MLQQNTSGQPLDVIGDPTVTIAIDGQVDHPTLLAGFTAIAKKDAGDDVVTVTPPVMPVVETDDVPDSADEVEDQDGGQEPAHTVRRARRSS